MYPKISKAKLGAAVQNYASTSDTRAPDGKPVTFTSYDFSTVNLHVQPRYLIPKTPNPVLSNMRVAAGGNLFYIEGAAESH